MITKVFILHRNCKVRQNRKMRKDFFKYDKEKDEGVRNKGHYAVCSRDFSDE